MKRDPQPAPPHPAPQAHRSGACEHPETPVRPALAWTAEQLETAAGMCQALGDPPRLRLLLWLAQGEMCVSELVACDEGRLGSVSARLQLLYGARLVTRRRDAKHVFYALADDHVRALLANVLGHAAEAG